MMKKKLLIHSFPFLLLFISCTKNKNESQVAPVASDTLSTGWKKIQINDSAGFLDVFFINNTGFAAGENIFKSSDGGESWSKLASPSGLASTPLFNLSMGSTMNALFITPTQLVVTHNGGASFTTKALPDPAVTDVFFIDSIVAYAIGHSVWKTIDAGDNWIKLNDIAPSNGWNSLFFTNELTGWLLKKTGAYKTINGGIDWQRVNTDTINLDQAGAIFFLNSDTGYFSNNLSIEKTVNGGTSWNKVFACTTNTYHDIHFVSSNIGYITDGPRIFKTADGGNTWTKEVALGSISNSLIELHFTDANHGWACGAKGAILKFNQ
ncbi:hypothetical protein EFY79_02130 [Hanamia caeni]|uniref:Photosynthesis system II assembly factor Ycf48/Hcf136-like domain-containing protein n=1 Tax=Hanamia caeni TaxID=2294116 RepID=A0A3M9NQR2_9BACT|nr:YCF48-related protein [Hanamia caeni]RNI40116.1 hypothetical protein EFY79_02130 [Hanamia caeni]